jgi:hypothetical protein
MSPTPRRALETVAVGVLAAGLAAVWFGFPAADVVCGPGGARWAWALAAGEGAGPWSPFGSGFAALGEGWGWFLTIALAVGAGAGVVWALARAAGADTLGAALAVVIASSAPVFVREVAAGAIELALVPFIALALGLLPSGAIGARLVGLAAVIAVGAADARTGVVLGLAAAVGGGGPLALLGAFVAAGSGVAVAATHGAVDPVDIGAPLLTLRPEAVPPGLAALAAALWFAGGQGYRRAAIVAFVCALGPILSAFGDPLTIGGYAVPLPAVAVAILTPGGAGWAGALVIAAVASGLGLAKATRAAWILVPVALLEMRAVVSRPECLTLDVPIGVAGLAERTGGVLDLPVRVRFDGQELGAPSTAHALYKWQGTFHGRRVATGLEPLGASDPLLGEPAVVLALNAVAGAGRFLMPPTRPGEVLRGLGVTEVVVHRTLLDAGALAVLDPILLKLYGAPQRDHAGGIDLYRIATTGSARPPAAESLHPSDRPGPKGWLEVSAWLAGFEPPGAAPAGAGEAGTREGARKGEGTRPAAEAGEKPAGVPKGPPLQSRGRRARE